MSDLPNVIVSSEKVNRDDFDHAKCVLERKVDSWTEATIYDITTDIAKEDLEEFGQLLIEQLGISDEAEKKKITTVCKMSALLTTCASTLTSFLRCTVTLLP